MKFKNFQTTPTFLDSTKIYDKLQLDIEGDLHPDWKQKLKNEVSAPWPNAGRPLSASAGGQRAPCSLAGQNPPRLRTSQPDELLPPLPQNGKPVSKLDKLRRSVRGRLVETYSKERVESIMQGVVHLFETQWMR